MSLHLFLAACVKDQSIGGMPTLLNGIPCKDGEKDFTSLDQVGTILGNVTLIILTLAGYAAIIIIIAASIYYITSAGDAARIKRAKDMIVNAVVGLVIILVSYAVVLFISGAF